MEKESLFSSWRAAHRLSRREVAEMLGVNKNTISIREQSGEITSTWEAFARVVGTLPSVEMTTEGGSYGQPVARFDGDPQVYGPADVIRKDGRIAGHVVALWALFPERTDDEYQAAKRFLLYWPEGPHLR